MMDHKHFAIGVLSVTATILFVGLVLVSSMSSSPVYGNAQNGRGGDYIVATGQLDDSVELLYVLDSAVPALAIYHFDPNRGGLILDDRQSLSRFVNAGPGAGARP